MGDFFIRSDIFSSPWYTYDYRYLCVHVVVIVLVRRMIILSQYDSLVFVVVMQRLFIFG